jgi:hypothetical protein
MCAVRSVYILRCEWLYVLFEAQKEQSKVYDKNIIRIIYETDILFSGVGAWLTS